MAKARVRRKSVYWPDPPLVLGPRQEQKLGALLPPVLQWEMKMGARSARSLLKISLGRVPLKTHPRAGRDLLQSARWPNRWLRDLLEGLRERFLEPLPVHS